MVGSANGAAHTPLFIIAVVIAAVFYFIFNVSNQEIDEFISTCYEGFQILHSHSTGWSTDGLGNKRLSISKSKDQYLESKQRTTVTSYRRTQLAIKYFTTIARTPQTTAIHSVMNQQMKNHEQQPTMMNN